MRRWLMLFVCLGLLGSVRVAGSVQVAAAQAERVKAIPVIGAYPQIRLSPDGHTLAIFEMGIFYDGEIIPELVPVRLFDLNTLQITATLNGPTDYANEVTFTSDGSRVMTYHDNGDMFIWDAQTGSLINRVTALPLLSGRGFFYPDSSHYVMACQANLLLLCEWDTDNGSMLRLLRPQYATRNEIAALFESGPAPTYIAFDLSDSGDRIAAATSYGVIDIWDVATGEQVSLNVPTEFPLFNIMSLAFINNDEQIVFYDADSELIRVIDARNGSEVRSFSGGPTGSPTVALAADGDHIAWVSGEPEAPIITVSSLTDADEPLVINLPVPEPLRASRRQMSMYFMPDGLTLVVGGFANQSGDSNDNLIFLVDVTR